MPAQNGRGSSCNFDGYAADLPTIATVIVGGILCGLHGLGLCPVRAKISETPRDGYAFDDLGSDLHVLTSLLLAGIICKFMFGKPGSLQEEEEHDCRLYRMLKKIIPSL
eukprot:CAMPEP_0170594332 /NCGR_PEP_ID=MMETSP0224-20130122/13940_1 /TAXON_ID=285029 /ORGANISM="Togula jolla, Strain CCCM 725" /LENGTH=108 /DNA_ID=CAMNT_0010918375 /DNA_START=42 /DNA_END=368 /DNA_ORIENTATION=+